MSEWISVEDELPEKSKYSNFSKAVLGYCEHTKSQYTVSYYYHERVFVHFPIHGFDIVHGGITHWQPLPEPPK